MMSRHRSSTETPGSINPSRPADRTATTGPAPIPAVHPPGPDLLDLALAHARRSIGLSDPNPRVGCVIAAPDGRILGEGHTQEAGGPHAEVMALRDARARGNDVRGAEAWVTLEPCAHHGRTPPCADALIAAGIARVVVGTPDPFASVNGAGMRRLVEAGIRVDVARDSAWIAKARELNIGFFHRHEHGRPWVRIKAAISLDGRTALPNGRSQWITGLEARLDGHAWRQRAGAIVTGIGTILHDDPRLDVREVPTRLQPLRVILDAQARLPATARVLAAPGKVLWCTAPRAPLQEPLPANVQALDLPRGGHGLDLHALLRELAVRDVNEVHVEAGARLTGAFLESGLADELLLYVAPRLLGPGLPLAALAEREEIRGALDFQLREALPLGPDLRLRLVRCT